MKKGSIEVVGLVVFLAVIIGVILLIVVSFTGLHINTGSGKHVGYITAVESSGLIFKTETAYIKTDLSSSQEDNYCVIDSGVYSDLERVSRTKEKVEVTHVSYFSAGINNCAGEGAVITKVEVIK